MGRRMWYRRRVMFAWLVLVLPSAGLAQARRALTFEDVMKFKAIKNPVLSEKGQWIGFAEQPDRGDGAAVFQKIRGDVKYTVERGARPAIAHQEKWAAVVVKPKAIDLEKSKKQKPKPGMALVNLSNGQVLAFEKIQRFAFSNDGQWLVRHYFAKKEKRGEKGAGEARQKPGKKGHRRVGSKLVLRSLASGREWEIPAVLAFAFDSSSTYLAYAIADTARKAYGLYVRHLKKQGAPETQIMQQPFHLYTNLSWNTRAPQLAFVAASENAQGEAREGELWLWDGRSGETRELADSQSVPGGWMIPSKNYVTWTRDGQRIFFGLRPQPQVEKSEESAITREADLFETRKILQKREVDVWHWNDPRIIPHQKKLWKRMQDTTYTAVYHLDSGKVVQLADSQLTRIFRPENPGFALGMTDVPYQKLMTWVGRLNDFYVVNLRTGERTRVAKRLWGRPAYLSPKGKFVVYYKDQNWHLYDCKRQTTRNLTQNLPVVFFNEDHDYPMPPPGYGIAGWVENDAAVLIYDKYDIWQFPTDESKPLNLTRGFGRKNAWILRVRKLDPKKTAFGAGEKLLLLGYHDRQKHNGIFTCRIGRPGVEKLFEEHRRLRILAKAKKANTVLFTRERYDEFPDLWVTDLNFKKKRKLTDINPQMREFAWGKAELVSWRSLDGTPLQGVLIRPGNYQPGKRYPVIVYFYRFFSQRLHEFNQPVINHRPCFALYASNGYAIFLPDIRFEIGRPGFAATKCLVPGVQKLVDMGVADPRRIGLHGHSWSGYQTAFIITQTNIFACAIAGAPVSNMTSAYSGIRWGSGLARQFQYEQSQSRIGGSLWEYPERYIENSPVFFADRIQTPLLFMFGDKDGAVPWYQGIELYLAMRRLGKNAIFLQYRGEPHHLQKYPNKLDYAIKMKQYFDHYLKGLPAAEWIEKGVPYQGK